MGWATPRNLRLMNRSKECLVRGLLFLRSKPKWFKISIGLICFALGLNLANVLLPVSLEPKQQARIVVAENGLPLRKFADEQGVWRYPVQIENLSPLYIDILLNYEDRYFYHHFGINPIALVRAAWQWGRYGRIISGGSTISMQVARLVRPLGVRFGESSCRY